jgi:hypothetical protein
VLTGDEGGELVVRELHRTGVLRGDGHLKERWTDAVNLENRHREAATAERGFEHLRGE